MTDTKKLVAHGSVRLVVVRNLGQRLVYIDRLRGLGDI
jgi:hypothetical protein